MTGGCSAFHHALLCGDGVLVHTTVFGPLGGLWLCPGTNNNAMILCLCPDTPLPAEYVGVGIELLGPRVGGCSMLAAQSGEDSMAPREFPGLQLFGWTCRIAFPMG